MQDRETRERNERLMALPGYVVLIKKPDDETIYGPVEHSFSLAVEPNRTRFYWSGTAYDNIFGARHELNGRHNAEQSVAYWKGNHPDWEFSIHDARDADALPVVINWPLWLDAHEPADNIAGRKNKHECRNVRFIKKGEDVSQFAKSAPLLNPSITMIRSRA